MSWQFYNPNPESKFVGDCVVRALSFACNQDWNKTYLELSSQGYLLKDIYSGNNMDYSRGWDVDYSYARGRDARGRYSGHNNNDDVIDRLTGMMRSARTEEERENYRKMIEQLSR